MLGYVTIGANDIAISGRFYDALLLPIGYQKRVGEGYVHYWMTGAADPDNGPGTVFVMTPFDGGVATAGNGITNAFRATDDAKVRALHAAGIAAGGSDEGAPGTRDYYSAGFYVAYLRDPVGNKVALFTVLEEQS